MLDYLKNLWHNTFGDPFPTFETLGRYSDKGPIFGYQPPPNAVLPPPPEPPVPPQPSCFAKGIAASLRDEPEAWTIVNTLAYTFSTTEVRQVMRLSVRHAKTLAHLAWYDRYDKTVGSWGARCWSHGVECVVINGVFLDKVDVAHILSTIRAHPLGQYKVEMDREKAEQEQQAAVKAHFEHLGCPPSS